MYMLAHATTLALLFSTALTAAMPSLTERQGNCRSSADCGGLCCSQYGYCGSGPEYFTFSLRRREPQMNIGGFSFYSWESGLRFQHVGQFLKNYLKYGSSSSNMREGISQCSTRPPFNTNAMQLQELGKGFFLA
ncbi:hypothetical protein DL95DRAFT_400017 [Leptodontidium sp. 2 PMI_412]|nr:hypothetical protein DL95DRAFT_400017 [Leptodontidium sp. 2 PMI_412]